MDLDLLTRNVKVVAEGLARYIFGLGDLQASVFEGSHAVHQNFLHSWINTVSSFPRVCPYVATTSPLFAALEKALGEFSEVTKQSQSWDGEVVPPAIDAEVTRPTSKTPSVIFYGPSSSTLAVHKVKPGTFDLLLTLVTLAYLGLLYMYFKVSSPSQGSLLPCAASLILFVQGVSETAKQVRALLTAKESKKRR